MIHYLFVELECIVQARKVDWVACVHDLALNHVVIEEYVCVCGVLAVDEEEFASARIFFFPVGLVIADKQSSILFLD